MLSLSPTLAVHQQSANRQPAFLVTTQAKRNTAHIFRWSRVYRGSEPDDPRAACVTANGRLVVARNASGTLLASYPWAGGTGINPAAWAVIDTGLVTGSGVALIARAGEVLLFYTKTLTLYVRSSSDNGVTWGAATALVTEGSAIGDIAASWSAAGPDCCAFYTLGTSTTLKRLRRIAGTWAASGTNWTKSGSVASIANIAATHDGADFALLVNGTEVTTTHKRAWAVQMGDLSLPANTWSGFSNVAEADSASTTLFGGASITSIAPGVYGTFAHRETGAVAAVSARESHPYPSFGPTSTWSEPAPMEAASVHGFELAYGSGTPNTVYAVAANGWWQAAINGADDLSARVVSCKVRFGPATARCVVEFDNGDGALAALPSAAFPGTMTGGQLTLSPGYLSGAAGAAEYGVTWRLTIDRIRYRAGDGHSGVTIEASGPWEQLRRWRAPQTWQTASGVLTRYLVANRIAGRAGIGIASAGTPYAASADFNAYSPSFAIAQGEDGATALGRLLAPLTDGVRGESGLLTVRNLDAPLFAETVRALAPQAWWRLQEPGVTLVQDHANAIYPAVSTGGLYATTGRTPGPLVGQSPSAYATLDGIDDTFSTASAAALDLASGTYVALVRTANAGTGTRRIFSRAAGGTFFTMGLIDNVLAFGDSADGWTDTRGTAINNGQWRLLCVTRAAGSIVTFYVDGVAVGTRASGSAATVSPAAALFMGAKDGAGTDAFKGDIAEAMVFNSALSSEQVAALWLAVSPAVYAYGGAGEHPVAALSLGDEPPATNWLRLQGSGRFSDRFDGGSVAQHGARFDAVRNLDADTNTKTDRYTAGALRRAGWHEPAGELTAPFNAGQELFDLVRVTHRGLAPATAIYRVLGLGLDYERAPRGARYDSVLALGAP
ncbi:MAG: LamG domain-containing protein [Chloroflexi bacterium]|nr:LamG domain-containing protein [Chloroflexota bacterium]